jgi:phytoene synthase
MIAPLHRAQARAALAAGSRSFALAGKLLPSRVLDDAAAVYAFCRRADDQVDEAPPGRAAAAVLELQGQVAALFAGIPQSDPVLAAFQEVAARRRIPRRFVDWLILGFAMDALPVPVAYHSWDQLMRYCFRVAGTVGLMMCRVMGTRDPAAERAAAALGMAMQLTNIARDVAEDWQRGRLYIPATSLDRPLRPEGPLEGERAAILTRAVPALLATAEPLYRWGDWGLAALDTRSAMAVRAARLIYSAIGDQLAARGCDVDGQRVVVSPGRKLWLALRALVEVGWTRLSASFRALP